MAYYTPDGIRHNTVDEALEHTKDFLITETTPVADEIVKDIHKHDWGKFDIQCSPLTDSGELYIELAEPMVSIDEDTEAVGGGYNLVKYSSFDTDKTLLIAKLEEKKRFVSMVGHEISNLLDKLSSDNNYLYDSKVHNVAVEMTCNSTDMTNDVITYEIDGEQEGTVECLPNEDSLELVLHSIKNHFIKELEGKVDKDFRIDGNRIGVILYNAHLHGRTVKLSILNENEEV